VAPLNTTTALTALTDVDVELAVNGLARDIDLELVGDVGLVKWAAAVGADAGQGCLADLVDLVGGGRSVQAAMVWLPAMFFRTKSLQPRLRVGRLNS
jgi:hypothetical protein